ncbi:glycosyltransferase family 4 protein [Streptomyces olivoreticuli]|uniref:glycosyltransferase family 4 protein n=1 Tax=Streptomyces olivoreticuli TaxID=68246 RepID=UPI0026586F8A|nr:glycosyltransferase family 4 protein [Streptomyces olivoreticuli]WKK26933.1 glycosyltransferase family 4 protein [Streptomyces olivoreticuli]
MTPAVSGPVVATALDMPAGSPGGSIELFLDLYTGRAPLIPSRAFMLAPTTRRHRRPAGLGLLRVDGKCLEGPGFSRYVTALTHALAGALDAEQVGVVHLHHLAFGATPALLDALPGRPAIALVHGTDLIFAQAHRRQHQVLLDSVRRARAIVVPTAAMADHLLHLAPATDRAKIAHIPWGVPDHLVARPPRRSQRPPGGPLRLLYAGRLTPEKGVPALLQALAAVKGVELSIAAPRHQFCALAPVLRQWQVTVRYLGWLRRPQLWRAFTGHDLLVMPSTTLEAMGLVALEAQACGLPVLYQPVPGLAETLSSSAVATDFTRPAVLARDLQRLRTTPGLLTHLRQTGQRNAARYRLSATATALAGLGHQIS